MPAWELEEDVTSADPNACAAAMPREAVAVMRGVTRECMLKGDSHILWVLQMLSIPGVAPFPRVEMGTMLLNHCFAQPSDGIAWVYLKYAISLALVCPLLTVGVLTARLIPVRQQHPDWYQSFLELTSTFLLCLAASKPPHFRERCVRYVDEALQLSQLGDKPVKEFGTCISLYLFCLINRLTDAITEDWSSPPAWNESHKLGSMHGQMAVMEMEDGEEERRREEKDHMRKANSLLALQLVTKILENNRTATVLRLTRRMLPDQWSMFARNLRSLEILSQKKLPSTPKEAPQAFANLAAAFQRGLHREWRLSQLPVIQALLDSGSQRGYFGNGWGVGCINPWLPLDIYMEAAMVRHRLHVKTPSACIADIMRALHAVQGFSWHEVFLGTWTAALRLVQRDCEWAKGPRPLPESRLCILLSHVPLACALIIEEEGKGQTPNDVGGGDSISVSNGNGEDKEKQFSSNRRAAFVLSLQVLGQFEALLYPPKIAIAPANQAAASIALVIGTMNSNASAMEGGNLRHLIVEACISRGLLDYSAYFWLGKTGSGGTFSAPNHPQSSPWTAFMEGAPLTSSLQAALTSSPAGSLAELEKVYQIAVSGPDEERAAAASILCGASFSRGWNVQEHAVRLAVQLLSPPPLDTDNRGPGSHLIAHGPMLSAALDSMTSEEMLRILALSGMIPQLAAALLPICEIFGSLQPTVPPASGSAEDVYKIFSLAFLLLVRLWKFLRPPFERGILGCAPSPGADLSLEYLLQIRATQAAGGGQGDKSSKDTQLDPIQASKLSPLSPSYARSVSSARSPALATQNTVSQNVTVDSFPKLKAWYTNHQAIIASPLSGRTPGTAAHNVADRLLKFMFRKFGKSTSSGTTGSSSTSSGQNVEDKPALPAWDVIAAVPVVVDEVLKACSHGTLRPRDLTTGLRDMVEFLPATIASVASCCGLEVYRGLHTPASMNGNDWPSPAANLFSVEAEIQSVLENSGVNVPNLITGSVGGNAPAVLPLPLAALLSLTITCKMDRPADKRVFSVAGPALENASMGGPWPSMAVVAALWSQKMPQIRDVVVFNATQAVFQQDKQAISQILRSCFAVGLSTSSSPVPKLQGHGGVAALLGHGRWHDPSSGVSAIGPAILYLTTCPSLHDILFVCDEILTLVAEASREIAVQGLVEREIEPTGLTAKLSCARPSLSTAVARAAQASTLGAALLFISGGAILVRQLFVESLPTWLLSRFRSGCSKHESQGTVLEGYAIARFAMLSAALAWGTSCQNVPGIRVSLQRRQVLSVHLELLASGLDGKISIKCKHTTWRSYVIGFIALIVTCTPEWILDVKVETLQTLAKGLRWWQQHELAFTLLEHGGPAAVGAAAEHAMG